jgi:hypothetical protein
MIESHRAVPLKLAAAAAQDRGQPWARLSRAVLARLGLDAGDLVEVAGARAAALRAQPAHVQDEGIDIVRVDTDAHDLGTQLGSEVLVSALRPTLAERVVLRPESGRLHPSLSLDELRATLRGAALLSGDVVEVQAGGEGFEGSLRLLGINLLAVRGHGTGAAPLRLRVLETAPPAPVQVTDRTRIELRDEG